MRLLPDIESDAFYQMATDEAILNTRVKQRVPDTLRFYSWKPPAVSLGYFQSAEQEVNHDYLKKHKIDLVRRITGGGAVYHDKEITYSIVIHKNKIKDGDSILGSYKTICGAIIKGFKTLGINAHFSPINDITVNGKKISGNAQTRRGDIILQHGTILMEVEPEIMFSVLNVSKAKISDKIINKIEDRVTSFKELGISHEKIRTALLEGFQEIDEINKGKLTNIEIKESKKLENKFSSKEWIYKR